MATTITSVIKAIFQSQGADKVKKDIEGLGLANEEATKKQTRLGNQSTNNARAFAAQSSGLGGLVAAYAGAAATTFALQQAFSALQAVANFQETIAGTNALAASFGQSGPQILKTIQEITKGQLSLKQAAETANIALAAGFNVTQISKLNEVATKASKALGRDLTDSVNRLTRGAAKLEPELLDELGIFTRIDPAVEAYASKVGRAVSSLTNFERRQAFVNAIIDEGSRKYSEINLSVDSSAESFNRLVARLSDAANVLGAFVTDLLAPIADFFSEDLGNSIFLFLGILALALSKGRTLLEGFFNTLSEQAALVGQRTANKLAGPEVRESFKRAGEILGDASLKGLSSFEKTYFGKIKTGDLQPQEIAAAQQALGSVITREKTSVSPEGDRLEGKRLDRLQNQAAAASYALDELNEAQKKVGAASTTTGAALQTLSVGFFRLANGVATVLSYFNIFIGALGAVQLAASLFLGVDILGKVFDFFKNLREESEATTKAVSALISEISKGSIIQLKFQFNPEELKEIITEVSDIVKSKVAPGIFNLRSYLPEAIFPSVEKSLKEELKILEAKSEGAFFESSRKIAKARADILREFIASGAAQEKGLATIAIQAPGLVGGQAEDFVKLFTTGALKQGAIDFSGVLTQILNSSGEIDKYTGKIALNIGLGIRETQKFYEEQSKGQLNAESASQRNIALGLRLEEIEKSISEARFKVNNELSESESARYNNELRRLEAQKEALSIQKETLAQITKELAERERIRKAIQSTFGTQIKFVENLPTSGLFNPDRTIARDPLEVQRNQLEFLGKRGKLLSEELKIEEYSLTYAKDREAIAKAEVRASERRGVSAEQRNRALAALQEATNQRGIAEAKITAIQTEQKEVLQAQIGFLKQAGDLAFSLAKQEEKRTLEYEKQLKALENEYELILLQNELTLNRAQSEAAQRVGQDEIKVLEARLELSKAILQRADATLKSRQADLDILDAQAERVQKLADAESALSEARINLRSTRDLGFLESQRESMQTAAPLFTRQQLINQELKIAEVNYRREIDLINIKRQDLTRQQQAETAARQREEQRLTNQIAQQNAIITRQEAIVKAENEIITKRQKLERDRLTAEGSQLITQQNIVDQRLANENSAATEARRARDFELNLIDRQLDLLNEQATVFETFLKEYERLIKKQLGEAEAPAAESIFKNFREDLTRARSALERNRTLSQSIEAQQIRNNEERSRGAQAELSIQRAAAAQSLTLLVERQNAENAAREELQAAQRANNQTELKVLQDKLAGLAKETEIAQKRYDKEFVELAEREARATQSLADARRKAEESLNTFRNIFIDVTRGIQESISTNVLGLFTMLNKGVDDAGNRIKDIFQALEIQGKKLLINILESIQRSIATRLIIEPINDLVAKGMNALFSEITGKPLVPTTMEGVITKVYDPTTNALRVVSSAEVGAGRKDVGAGTGVAAQAKETAKQSEGLSTKLESLGVNFQVLGTVAVTTFASVLAATRDWKKAFLYTLATTFATALTQIATNQISSGAVSGMFGAGISGFASSVGNWFKGFAPTPTGVGIVAPGAIGSLTALGGEIRKMAIGGPTGRDSVPALLEPGEFVIRRPSAMAIGGDTLNHMNATGQVPASGNVTVNVNNQGTPQQPAAQPVVTRQGENIVVDIILRDMQNNGPIRRTMRGMR